MVPISPPVIISNAIAVQMTSTNKNNSHSSVTIFPEFEANLQLSSAQTNNFANNNVGLYPNCSLLVVESVSVLCLDSHVWLNLTCTGKAAATINRKCPIFQKQCSLLNLKENELVQSNYCETIVSGTDSIICRCGHKHLNDTDTNSLIGLNGMIAVTAVGLFTPSRMDASVVSASKTLSEDVATKSAIIFIAFGILWTFTLILLVSSGWFSASHNDCKDSSM